jgi:predicted Zn-dependent protease
MSVRAHILPDTSLTSNARSSVFFPSLEQRFADGRPVMSRDKALEIAKYILSMTATKTATVSVSHLVRSVTRLASDRVRDTNDGDMLYVSIRTGSFETGAVMVMSNQLDDEVLREMVERADTINREMRGPITPIDVETWDEQDRYPTTDLYRASSVDALRSARETAVPAIIDGVTRAGCRASGFVGVMVRADASVTKNGVVAFSEETDCEVNVTARTPNGVGSGWSGTAARDWARIDPARVASEAADIANRGKTVQALEPGRRTAILSQAAVAQLMRFMVGHFNGSASDYGLRGFSKRRYQNAGSRFNQRLLDPRVRITTDPADPDGGFRPWFGKGYVNHPTTWIDQGMLKYLGYGVAALEHGKPYTELPYGFRLAGGDSSLEQMIASCDDGIYVNRLSSVDILDWPSGLMTGVTRDGCFLVRNGRIDRALKNFRITTSPFFFFNNLMAIGKSSRAAFGYSPWTVSEEIIPGWGENQGWPRRPMIVPPLMVRDFNFSALVDAT